MSEITSSTNSNSSTTTTAFFTKNSNYPIKKISEFEFVVEKREGKMKVPVRIYANEILVSSMVAECTIGQAINVSTLPGVRKHVVILPDGHEGYGFPVGGVAAMDLEEGGVISPGGVGYDINCGVRLIRTNLTEKDVKPKKNQGIS